MGKLPAAVGQGFRRGLATTTDHDRQTTQLRTAQQFDRRIERAHVQVGTFVIRIVEGSVKLSRSASRKLLIWVWWFTIVDAHVFDLT